MKRQLLSGMVLFMVSAAVMAQQSFSSPEQATSNVAHLVVGDNGWQLPIPVVKTASGWQFDMQ